MILSDGGHTTNGHRKRTKAGGKKGMTSRQTVRTQVARPTSEQLLQSGGGAPLSALPANGQVQRIPLTSLRPGPWQPRREFDADALADLALSIRVQGVLTPLRIVQTPTGSDYLIVAGERRWRAA